MKLLTPFALAFALFTALLTQTPAYGEVVDRVTIAIDPGTRPD